MAFAGAKSDKVLGFVRDVGDFVRKREDVKLATAQADLERARSANIMPSGILNNKTMLIAGGVAVVAAILLMKK